MGSTAGALVSTPGLETLDVVDISRDVLELGRAAVPGPRHPLSDPRVRVHIEDGRQFLLLTTGRYDVITAEPPPPHNAGIVNLFPGTSTRAERLVDSGVVTYWLPTRDHVRPGVVDHGRVLRRFSGLHAVDGLRAGLDAGRDARPRLGSG